MKTTKEIRAWRCRYVIGTVTINGQRIDCDVKARARRRRARLTDRIIAIRDSEAQ